MNPTAPGSEALSGVFHRIFKVGLFTALALTLTNQLVRADSAAWTGNSGYFWYTAGNWAPETIPDGPDDIATFGISDKTNITLFGGLEVNSIVFQQNAVSYDYTLTSSSFSFRGTGISNNSGRLQSFVCDSICFSCGSGYPNSFNFYNSATAGELTAFTTEPPFNGESFGGELVFWDSSTAGSALINNIGSNVYGPPASTYFEDDSSAENATIINGGSIAAYTAGHLYFDGNSTAGHATIINNGALSKGGQGGQVRFYDSSDSGDSTIICNGDTVGSDFPAALWLSGKFGGGVGVGGRARVILLGNGELDVRGGSYRLEVTVGSIEGDGNIFLGEFVAGKLTVGTNNLNTTFSGIIQDRSSFAGGSLTKVGTGTLALTGANTYAGATTITAGELRINNRTGSGTGTGDVQVKGGTLSGRGTIAGMVTVGAGLPGAILSPGDVRVGTLTIQSEIIFKAESSYACTINIRSAQADDVVANGVAIDPGAIFSISASGHRELPAGTVFAVISNTAAAPISGAFSNLADGAIVSVNGNNLQASYSGGDGNDLTLTVVP